MRLGTRLGWTLLFVLSWCAWHNAALRRGTQPIGFDIGHFAGAGTGSGFP